MSKVYETLKKKNDTSVEVYPNIERTNIPDGAINTDKLEDGSITTDKILDFNVTETKLANQSVSTYKLANEAVTATKIKDSTITSSKIGIGQILNYHIANNSISLEKLNFHLYAYVGSTLEFTDNGDSIIIYTPLILSTYAEDIYDLRTDIAKFMNLWKKMYYDSYVYTRGSINGTVYDVTLNASDPDNVNEISVSINGNSYTISSFNYDLVDCQRINII